MRSRTRVTGSRLLVPRTAVSRPSWHVEWGRSRRRTRGVGCERMRGCHRRCPCAHTDSQRRHGPPPQWAHVIGDRRDLGGVGRSEYWMSELDCGLWCGRVDDSNAFGEDVSCVFLIFSPRFSTLLLASCRPARAESRRRGHTHTESATMKIQHSTHWDRTLGLRTGHKCRLA
eukprot:4455561-Prymnesium_polylepis.1